MSKPLTSRRKAYIETEDQYFRIRKGEMLSEWKLPTELATVAIGDHIYFAFMAPLSPIMGEMLDPGTVYHCMATKTKERKV